MDTNMDTNNRSHNHSYIYYTFLAGWCAESAGARLEFRKCLFSESEVNNAMHMTGQNTSGVEPGQLTDDSEMELYESKQGYPIFKFDFFYGYGDKDDNAPF